MGGEEPQIIGLKATSTLKTKNGMHWCHFLLDISQKVATSMAKLTSHLCSELQPAVGLSRGDKTI